MDWLWEHAEWIFLGICGIIFIIFSLPRLILTLKDTKPYGEDDPSGNDNVNRKFHDYM